MPTDGRLHIRFSDEYRDLLDAISDTLTKQIGVEFDASATVRLLVVEKARKLGIPVPEALGGSAPKKKRRAPGA